MASETQALCLLLENVVPAPLSQEVFNLLESEVDFTVLTHKGGPLPRLVSVQGSNPIDPDGSVPLYRHPLDPPLPSLVPFTPTVLRIKAFVEHRLQSAGLTSPSLNHCLIQLYRNGNDYISEHADKTLDLHPNSVICNYSVGATRKMVLRRKDRVEASGTTVFSLNSNSLFVLPLDVNRTHTHAIKQDRRAPRDHRPDELGPRISLTFRSIATFFSPLSGKLRGRGAPRSKVKEGAVVDAATTDDDDDDDEQQQQERERLVKAFAAENKTLQTWDELYSGGFSVLTV